MRNRTIRIAIAAVALSGLLFAAFLHFGASAGTSNVQAASILSRLTPLQKRILSGFADNTLDTQNAASVKSTALAYHPDQGDDQCAVSLGSNIKVNQNCLNLSDVTLQGRGQANNETAIAVNPNNANDLVVGNNDYRRGDGNCYGAYSLDNAAHWNDTTIPMGFTNGTTFGGVARQYWQAGGDTSVAWDTKGNVYFDCQMFMRGGPPLTNNPDLSSAVYVFRSTHNNGASWNFPGRPVVEAYTTPTNGSPVILEDKPYMTVDNHVGSPFQDRVYVTWTDFATDGSAYIFESYSSNYGESFSAPVVVSTTSSLCVNTFGAGTPFGTCNENQFSDPFTGPDGALYVVYANFNNATSSANDNHNQMLLSKSTDGGVTFSSPVLVANYNDLPDCATYQAGQDAGRACVPEKGSATNSVFRATNYPSGQVDPTNAKRVIVTFGSYINKDSNPSNGCVPTGFAPSGNNAYTGVKTPGACNNKILESVSTNSATSFNGTVTDPTKLTVVSSAPGQKLTDQWFQWSSFTTDGRLEVSYYDRQFGSDETTGNMDFSLSSSVNDPTLFTVKRVTSSSMPLPTEFPDTQGNSLFFGDYTGLAASANFAYPVWMDTRDKDLALCPGTGVTGVPPQVCTFTEPSGILANDQDIYMAKVAVAQ